MARLGIVRSFWLAGLVLWTLACASADAAEPRRVLLLHSFGPQFVPWNFITSRFREELTKQSPEKIDLYAMRTVDSRILKIESTRNASGTVSVSIEDSGPGIGEADRSRIFDPLFTTKTGGMGMGLSICRSIIESHGGKIWVSAAPLRGAIFRFELPASDSRDARQDLAA